MRNEPRNWKSNRRGCKLRERKWEERWGKRRGDEISSNEEIDRNRERERNTFKHREVPRCRRSVRRARCCMIRVSSLWIKQDGCFFFFLCNAQTVCTAKSEEHQSMKSEKRSWCSSALPRLSGGSSGCDRTENTAPGPSLSSPPDSLSLARSSNYWTLLPHYLSLSFVTPKPRHCFCSFFCCSHISSACICAFSCINFHFYLPSFILSSSVASSATPEKIKCIWSIFNLWIRFILWSFFGVCVCVCCAMPCSIS